MDTSRGFAARLQGERVGEARKVIVGMKGSDERRVG